MKRILTVMGTRPEAIKLCPLIKELRRRKGFDVQVCSTGQHGSLLDAAMAVFHVTANHSFDVRAPAQSLSVMGAKLLAGMDRILDAVMPSLVVVQGDTASAFFAALAAFQHRIPVGHVEAGLRTHCIDSPFPEELHRVAISLFAALHFAPTDSAREQLLKEGRDPATVLVTGNTVVDALRFTLKKETPKAFPKIPHGARLLIFTAHRRENLGAPMRAAFLALRRILLRWKDVVALCPFHPNPEIRALASEILQGVPRVFPMEPPELVTFHHLLSRAYLVITDSGGIQEEAVALGIPTLVTRTETEREEGVEAGVLRLVGIEEDDIFNAANELLLPNSRLYARMRVASSVYGDGHASERIADVMEDFLI